MSLSVVNIEDEIDIADLLALYCRREGWSAHLAGDGERGLETIRARQPDVVLLDVGLPGTLDGFGVCHELRATSNVPVLFLTARDHEIDRIVGLEMGADDYVTKPFSPREVIARSRRSSGEVRRSTRTGASSTSTPSTSTSVATRSPSTASPSLATQEFALLEYLLAHQGQVLSRDQILGAWRRLDRRRAHGRRAHPPAPQEAGRQFLPLATIRGVGYRLG